ncbi:hypothetical protein [Deinococcus aerophilus]|uniref:YbjN domain-containing protein n=1 Tax=Deinococcus aerophilus TaxID=522488 RepID=A0ABQ2GY04_9DEIO|nr:hypothetical protein [Deinococcus aerophilus]GGM16877.1 hypothetical protein GCM10010841_26470 [Deinococcus aerophilus]
MMTERRPAPPEHPRAAALLAALERVQVVLDAWRWDVVGEDLVVVTFLRRARVSLRIWLQADVINLDVWCATIAPDVNRLSWLLAQNLGQPFKARACHAEGGLHIYLTRDVPLDALDDLGALIWDAYEASLLTAGRLLQVAPAPAADHRA